MRAFEYRTIIRTITNNILNKNFPGLNKAALKKASEQIAMNVHARMYGANVDGVDSPLWKGEEKSSPNVEALELLKEI